MNKYILPLTGVLIETLSDVVLKFYVKNKKITYLYLGIMGYALTGFFFAKLLTMHKLATSNVIWHVSHFILLLLISVLYFKEKYTYKDGLSIGFGMLSLYFASHKHH
jgi:multidrug transporter EmrE-like cation transporter|tara:strand:+ start:265 stop:585 length:321 start_codon:yes stop_codon:yes gene_type:complete